MKNLGFLHLSHASHFFALFRTRIAMLPCVSSRLERAGGTYGKLHGCRILIHFAGSSPGCTLHVGQIVASTGHSRERESTTFCTNMDPRPSAGSGQACAGLTTPARMSFISTGGRKARVRAEWRTCISAAIAQPARSAACRDPYCFLGTLVLEIEVQN